MDRQQDAATASNPFADGTTHDPASAAPAGGPSIDSSPTLTGTADLPAADTADAPLDAVLRLLDTGGPVVWILAGLSLLLLTVALFKSLQFAAEGLFSPRSRHRADAAQASFLAGRRHDALDVLGTLRDARGRLLFTALSHLGQHTLDPEALRRELTRQGTATLAMLRSHLHTVELIASLAPLLGLLGTVLGMVEAFQAMELAGARVDPSTLSGGIWKALLTTAVGLSVAVPAIVLHNWLERRTERFAQEMDDRLGRLLTEDALLSPATTATPLPGSLSGPLSGPRPAGAPARRLADAGS